MADTELKVIVKAKELALHSFRLTSNCNRYPKKYRHSLVDRIMDKFNASYNAWKNHILHGDCYNLSKSMDSMVKNILKEN